MGTVSASREVGAMPADANASESSPARWSASRVRADRVRRGRGDRAAACSCSGAATAGSPRTTGTSCRPARSGSVDDLFRPHFQHWTTLPILPYRLLWTVVGIRSYVPYQALIVVLHLAAAALLLVVMRRAGVRPWIATVAAGAFVFFGSGAENILVAFQITFVGSLVFGLAQLLLADHDGPLDRPRLVRAARRPRRADVLRRRHHDGGRRRRRPCSCGAGSRVGGSRCSTPRRSRPRTSCGSRSRPKGQPAGNYRQPSRRRRCGASSSIGFEAAFARSGQIPVLGFAARRGARRRARVRVPRPRPVVPARPARVADRAAAAARCCSSC